MNGLIFCLEWEMSGVIDGERKRERDVFLACRDEEKGRR